MKEYTDVYIDSKGELKLAMNTEMFLGICLIFWALPLIALICWLWHFFTGNAKTITKKDYYLQRAKFHKKQEKLW